MSRLTRMLKHLALALCLVFPNAVLAQSVDQETNNSCPTAQDVGAVALPHTVDGSLDTAGGEPDIDFFRFSAGPGDLVRADHQGVSGGVGTLDDPLLALFDGDCNLIAINDDAGTLDSRLQFTVPGSGAFVLAATAFPDFEFDGSEAEGTYLLTLSAVETADSISGRLVSARDGMPVSGESPTFAAVVLYRCFDAVSCFDFVGFRQADSGGNFIFETDDFGNPLSAGAYRIEAFANGFEFFSGVPFNVAANQALDLGDIALTPFILIGSVSGRLVDALDGSPLSGFGPPFAFAELQRCEGPDCFGVAGASADEQGRFRFDGLPFSLPPGNYRVVAFAEDYRAATSARVDVAEDQDVDLGDVALTPLPIQFGAVQGCEIPPGGGLCEFGIELRNRGPGPFKGQVWSTVEYFPNEFPFRFSRFQVGRVGAVNPMPERLNLRVGQSVFVDFQLTVPGDLPDFSVICATATVGSKPDAQFRNFGDRFLFCAQIQSGQFAVLGDKEGRKRMRELRERQAR